MWCGKKNLSIKDSQNVEFKGENFLVCCDECKQKYEKAKKSQKKNRKKYIILLIIDFLIGLAICIANGLFGFLYLIESIGLTIFYYPYTTSETVKVLGIKRSRKIAQSIAIILMISGIIFVGAIFLTK